MYNSPNIAIRIKDKAKQVNITVKDLLIACELGSNAISHLNHGKSISAESLAKIADYLDCSVDYLLGRTDKPEVNR
jgi:transcriptional regulator with XRE-family HTH domain